jgi:hypothetical protein
VVEAEIAGLQKTSAGASASAASTSSSSTLSSALSSDSTRGTNLNVTA